MSRYGVASDQWGEETKYSQSVANYQDQLAPLRGSSPKNNEAVPLMKGAGLTTIESNDLTLVRFSKTKDHKVVAMSHKTPSEGTFSNRSHLDSVLSEEDQKKDGSSSGFKKDKFDNKTHVRLLKPLGDSETELSYPNPSVLDSESEYRYLSKNVGNSVNESNSFIEKSYLEATRDMINVHDASMNNSKLGISYSNINPHKSMLQGNQDIKQPNHSDDIKFLEPSM